MTSQGQTDQIDLIRRVVILVSADAEWRVIRSLIPEGTVIQNSPYGEWCEMVLSSRPVVFLHGGWGKIAAAGSAQYAIDRWQPVVLVNIGTCGGLDGRIERGEIVLVERTLVYDIIEQMSDPQAAINHYTVVLDNSWLPQPDPLPVRRALLVSADRDIYIPDIPMLVEQYGAVAADWESGAIAWVAARNKVHCLILRGVSDLVGESGGEAYQSIQVFHDGTRTVMEALYKSVPAWLAGIP